MRVGKSEIATSYSIMDRSGIISVERMPSVLSVETNVGSTLKQGDPSCWSESGTACTDAVRHTACVESRVTETLYKMAAW